MAVRRRIWSIRKTQRRGNKIPRRSYPPPPPGPADAALHRRHMRGARTRSGPSDSRNGRIRTVTPPLRHGFRRPYSLAMLTKLTITNQITLPEDVVEALGHPSHFRVEIDGSRLVLTPAAPDSAKAVRRKLDALALIEGDVADAVAWTRMKH